VRRCLPKILDREISGKLKIELALLLFFAVLFMSLSADLTFAQTGAVQARSVTSGTEVLGHENADQVSVPAATAEAEEPRLPQKAVEIARPFGFPITNSMVASWIVATGLIIFARVERGYLHCGTNGAGHFVKMVHNGIEYGIMAAYGEGLGVLRSANVGKRGHEVDAETTPLREPKHYQYDFNLSDIAEVWRRGSVVASWLLDLSASALIKDPQLKSFQGRVSDSGEGHWTIKAAVDEAVPVPVLSAALYERFTSRGEADFGDKLLSAMRYEFGGHLEKPSA
jgi:6-phosphogluconate dehydrogenase (decarboxylating)